MGRGATASYAISVQNGRILSIGNCVQKTVTSPQISWVLFVQLVTRGYKKATNWSHIADVELLQEKGSTRSFQSMCKKQFLAKVMGCVSRLHCFTLILSKTGTETFQHGFSLFSFGRLTMSVSNLAQMQTVCLCLHKCKKQGFIDVEPVLYNSLGRRYNPLLRMREDTQIKLQWLTRGLIMGRE